MDAPAPIPELQIDDREKRFCENVAMGLPMSIAAYTAGYRRGSDKSADSRRFTKILAKPHVHAYLEAKRRQAEDHCDISRKKLLDGLVEAISDAKLIGDPATMIKGWSEIAKVQGYYAPKEQKIKIEDAPPSEVLAKLGSLSEGELLKLAGDDVIEGEWFHELETHVADVVEHVADGKPQQQEEAKDGRRVKTIPDVEFGAGDLERLAGEVRGDDEVGTEIEQPLARGQASTDEEG